MHQNCCTAHHGSRRQGVPRRGCTRGALIDDFDERNRISHSFAFICMCMYMCT